LTHNIPVLLLDETLVVLEAGAGAPSREGELFLLTIGEQQFIDKLSSIIRIQPQQREGKALPCLLQRLQNRLLALIQQRHAFSPSCGNICERQGVEVTPLDV